MWSWFIVDRCGFLHQRKGYFQNVCSRLMAIMSKKPSLQVWGENVEIEKSTSPTNSINLQSKSLFPENDWFTKKSLDILELYFFFSTVLCLFPSTNTIFYRDTVSYGTALTWTILLPVWKASTSTRNQIYALDTSKNPLQSCLVLHSILDLLLKISFWANF